MSRRVVVREVGLGGRIIIEPVVIIGLHSLSSLFGPGNHNKSTYYKDEYNHNYNQEDGPCREVAIISGVIGIGVDNYIAVCIDSSEVVVGGINSINFITRVKGLPEGAVFIMYIYLIVCVIGQNVNKSIIIGADCKQVSNRGIADLIIIVSGCEFSNVVVVH